MKVRKIIIPTSILALITIVIFFPFSSTCSCLAPDVQFKSYIGISDQEEVTSDVVQTGFEKHLPKGTHFRKDDLFQIDNGENEFIVKKNGVVCTYYYEHKFFAKRGYRVVVEFDESSKITDIKAANISNWFGIEISSL